jgi:hypothetical protein
VAGKEPQILTEPALESALSTRYNSLPYPKDTIQGRSSVHITRPALTLASSYFAPNSRQQRAALCIRVAIFMPARLFGAGFVLEEIAGL